MPNITGTEHFKDRAAAVRYYRAYGEDGADVDAKLKEGAIHLGPPKAPEGAKVYLNNAEGRYMIEEAEKAKAPPVPTEGWHYRPETREVRDGNGILVAENVGPADGPMVAAAPILEAVLESAWHFIENVSPDDPQRTEKFFALREKVRLAFFDARAGYPAEYRPLEARGSKKPNVWYLLTYSKDRGFFEPISNRDAEPVIGKILEWKYA